MTSMPELDRSRLDEIYRRRAAQLAARHQATGPAAATIPALAFGLDTERYAIVLAELAEVLPYRGATAVPGAPAAMLGVINVRGKICGVVDLRRVLTLPPADPSAGGYVLVLRANDRSLGLRVDTLDHVQALDAATILAAGSVATGDVVARSRFVKALTADAVSLIDPSAVLSHLGVKPVNR